MSDEIRNPSDMPLSEAWPRVSQRLRQDFGEDTWRNWLKPLSPKTRDGDRVVLAAPSGFIRNWIDNNYAGRLKEHLRLEIPGIRRLEIIVDENSLPMADNNPVDMAMPAPNDEAVAPSAAVQAAPQDLLDRTGLDPRFTFDNFVQGKSNELALAAARRVAESTDVQFNPLYLYGGVGLGKTHLMHSIAWAIREQSPHRKVLYLSAEKFMYEFIRALRYKDTVAFKEQFRSVDVLMIDDVQFIAGKESTQEEFFHTFNALVDDNRQVILSADRSPSDLDDMEERLRSRLGWGLVADIHPTDFELRYGILESKVDQMKVGHLVSREIMEFMAHRITSNIRELEGALKRVVAHSTLLAPDRPVSEELVQSVLSDLLRANDRRVTVDDIRRKVAEHFNIRLSDLDSARRTRAIARPRQIAMYLCKQMTNKSLPEIGRKFGGRDHTTVMHAVRKIEELNKEDPGIAEDLDILRRQIGAQG